jgi:DNA sulfur modification protein DndC
LYGYVEALRLIYKAVSDIKDLRVPKTGGYSKLGPLTPLARSIVYNLVPIVEEKSGHRFYGLDETYIGDATLREIFYIMPEEKADRVVRSVDDTNRWIGMRHLRNIEKILYQQVEDKIIEKIKEYDHLGVVTRFAEELLNQLR